MNPLTLIALVFSVIAAVDYIFGSRLRIGFEFQRGFQLVGTMILSMVGMIVISPLLADILSHSCLSSVRPLLEELCR